MAVSELPGELLLLILQHCDPMSLCHCSMVCRQWRHTAGLLQSRPGYWHNAATSSIPRNCLMELISSACSDQQQDGDSEMQRTIFRFSIRTAEEEEDRDGAESRAVEVEASNWVRWREVWSTWMVSQSYVTQFTPEQRLMTHGGEHGSVSCMEVSGHYVVTGHGSGVRVVWDMVSGRDDSNRMTQLAESESEISEEDLSSG